MSVGSAVFDAWLGTYGSSELVRLFSLDGEGNLPTWFSSSVLLCAAIGCQLVARLHPAESRVWIPLGLFALWISFDETAQIHDRLPRMMAEKAGLGEQYHIWLLALPVLALFLMRTGARMWNSCSPAMLRRLLMIAACYASAASMEAVDWIAWAWPETRVIRNHTIVVIEECAELAAALLLLDMALSRLPILWSGRAAE